MILAIDFALRYGDVSGWTVGTVNVEVLRCPTVQASMDHDHQLERHTISDVKPVKLLMEQLRQSTIKLVCVAGDAHGSIEYVYSMLPCS